MSTNATAIVYSEWEENKPICGIYKHWDGYPDGFGDQLREFANSLTLVNGLGMETAPVANGMDCFAAQLVAHFKESPGDVYIRHPDEAEGEEYTYRLRPVDGKVVVTCDQEPDW